MLTKRAMSCVLAASVCLAPAAPRQDAQTTAQAIQAVKSAADQLSVVVKRFDQAQVVLRDRSVQLLDEHNVDACRLAIEVHYVALTHARYIEGIAWKASAFSEASCEPDRKRAREALRIDLSVNGSVYEAINQGLPDLPSFTALDRILGEQVAECSAAFAETNDLLTTLRAAIGGAPPGSAPSSESRGR